MKILNALNAEIARLETLQVGASDPDLRASIRRQLVRYQMAAMLLSEHEVEFRPLVRFAVEGRQARVASSVPIRRATISEYLAHKSAISADSLEAILNYQP